MKVVINVCFGGFGLSEEAGLELAKRKGIVLYNKPDRHSMKYYTEPDFRDDSYYSVEYPDIENISRHDTDLVAVVEEMGERAYGDHAELRVVDVPKGTFFRIHEYDGRERIEERDEILWDVAR